MYKRQKLLLQENRAVRERERERESTFIYLEQAYDQKWHYRRQENINRSRSHTWIKLIALFYNDGKVTRIE